MRLLIIQTYSTEEAPAWPGSLPIDPVLYGWFYWFYGSARGLGETATTIRGNDTSSAMPGGRKRLICFFTKLDKTRVDYQRGSCHWHRLGATA